MPNWPPRFARSQRPHRPLLGVLALAVLAVLTAASPAASSSTSTTYQVPSSIPADCSVDVTSQLLSWVGSVPDNSVLSFGAGACYRIEGTLELRNRTGLDLEGNGATFRSFNPPSDQRAIWRVIDSSGFVFRNMTIIGSYANGGTLDSNLQHAHAIDLRGTGAEVSNVSMSNLAGDCVYFGLGYSSATRSSGSVHDSTCVGTSRNAVSLTAADNVLVTRVTTDKIGLTAFDVEPNVGTGFGSNGATFDSNKIGTYYLYAFAVVEDEPVSNQSFTNNVVTGRGLRVGIVSGGGSYRASNITISGNSDTSSQVPAAIEGDNVDTLTVTGNTIPLTSGTMAAINNTCNATVSNNSYPGGSSQYTITNTPASCTTTSTTAAPSLGSFSPSSGSSGTSVTISGANLTGATAVTFNGAAASFAVNSASQITATVPSGATSGPIAVTTPGGTATSSTSFNVTAASTAPTVTSFSPSSGAPGTKVTLGGTNFTGTTAVKFNGVAATFTVVSAAQITTVVPKGAPSGPISVTTATGTGTSGKRFRVTK